MTRVEHREIVSRSTPFVYVGGLDTGNWPYLKNLSLEARDTFLSHGTDIEAAVHELGQHIGVPCRVTDLDPGRLLAFRGESKDAELALSLAFTAYRGVEASTQVDATLEFEIKNFIKRRTLGRLAGTLAKGYLKEFGSGFKRNIEALPGDHYDAHELVAS